MSQNNISFDDKRFINFQNKLRIVSLQQAYGVEVGLWVCVKDELIYIEDLVQALPDDGLKIYKAIFVVIMIEYTDRVETQLFGLFYIIPHSSLLDLGQSQPEFA